MFLRNIQKIWNTEDKGGNFTVLDGICQWKDVNTYVKGMAACEKEMYTYDKET